MADITSGTGTSAVLTIGTTINENLEFVSDQDWYRMQLVGGTTYTFAMTGFPVGGVEDPYLSIHNASGTVLAFNDDGSVGLDSLLTFTAASSGTYFLNATSYQGGFTGRYELISAIVSSAPIDDLPGDTTTPRQLFVGGSTDAVIETAFDEDAVYIDLVAGQRYVFQALGNTSVAGLTLDDPYLVIAGTDGVIVAENDDFGGTLDARIDFTATVTGRFYLGVFDISGDIGSYRITAALATAADPFTGGPGDDDLFGDNGDNTLVGLDGSDLLDGGGGSDRLFGGAGDDYYRVDSAGDLVFENPGEGFDSVTSSVSHYLYADVEALALAGGAGAIFGVGNGLDNRIDGNESGNLLIGGGGNDVIDGREGNDAVFGEGGGDILAGGNGVDYIAGGADDDIVDGGADADALYGEAGADLLLGGSGFVTDILVGGDGDDVLVGGEGEGDYDLMDGGSGDDRYIVDTPADLTFEAVGGGNDTVIANIAGAGYYLYANVENLVLEGDTPFGVGNEYANRLTGSYAANWLLGGAGDDAIDGGGGNDVLFGESGADTFVFGTQSGADVIGDFTPGIDSIRFTAGQFGSFAALSASLVDAAGTAALDLGNGDLVVFNGVPAAALSAADFVFG